jgi:hypothetical protein
MRFSVKHERTKEEARDRLLSAVADVQGQFGLMIDRIEWTDDQTDATVFAKGATVHIWVDSTEVHVTCDVPLLSKLLGGPLVGKFKRLVEDRFQKKLTEGPTP